MRIALYILLGLCVVWVSAAVALWQFLNRLVRRGKSGTEFIAHALAPLSLGAVLLAAPLGSGLAFVLAAGFPAGSGGRIVLTVLGGGLAAFFGASVIGAALGFLREGRRQRARKRVMAGAETIELIKTGAITRLNRMADGAVYVTYADGGWVDGVYDPRRAYYADPAAWRMFEAAVTEIPEARSFPDLLFIRDGNAHRRGPRR